MSSSGTIPASADEEVVYPASFGRYVLLSSLGRGGMGAVHLAKQGGVAGIEKYCVVKTLRKRHTDDAEYIARFMDEARLVVHLAHRNICPIFDVGRVGSKYYLAMELIEGRDLHTLVEALWARGQHIPEAIALHAACEVLEALDYAHRRSHPVSGQPLNIVHRDVSPHNVMVNYEGEVKLIDFGLAASTIKEERTDPNIVLGKLTYMSREHLRAQPIDGRHDLFGVAVMLYEMLVGERFYAGVEPAEILPLLAEGDHKPRRLAQLDEEIRAILEGALEHEARDRTSTCSQLRDQLQSYMRARDLVAGARELRSILDSLFPGEQQQGRALLQRFVDVHAPDRDEDQSQVIARLTGSGKKMRVIVGDLVQGHESAYDFDEVDNLVGAVSTAPQPLSLPPFAVPNPITEPTARIAFTPPALSDHGEGPDATTVLPRAARAAEQRQTQRVSAALVATVAAALLFVAAAVAYLMLDGGSPASALTPAEAASALPPPPETSPPAVVDPASPGAAGDGPSATAPAPSKEPAPATTRSAPRRKPPPPPERPKPPPLKKDAAPVEKVQYLDAHCKHLQCSRQLVGRFRSRGIADMSTDEVRNFWQGVNSCIETCTRPRSE